MAMELFVFSDKQLNSTTEWQAAIDREGYSLKLEKKSPIQDLKGFLPVQLRDSKTGFECGYLSADKLMRAIPGANFDHEWKFALTFRWGGDLSQLEAAWAASTAYAQATSGVIFDEQDGRIKTPDEAREVVRDIVSAMPKAEEILREIIGSRHPSAQ